MAAMETRRPRLLLHACCGPCLIEPADAFAGEHDVTVAYANPNIQPLAEYARRFDTLRAYAVARGLPVVELRSEPHAWARAVGPVAHDRPARCRACYAVRLGRVAEHAVVNGFDAVATTLTVSPYQDHDALRETAEEACARAGVAYLDRDFRPRFADAQRRARELGMYRQNHCGCLLSAVEADRERAERREARKKAREAATS